MLMPELARTACFRTVLIARVASLEKARVLVNGVVAGTL
jgi:hypothetical protein